MASCDEQEIIQPVDRELLKAELSEQNRLRFTCKNNNQIYVFTAQQAPNLMREVGRLRELSYRASGGGRGKSVDIDEFDTMEIPYRQLIVWDPDNEEILGGYRFIVGTDVCFDTDGQPILATAHSFHFSQKFIQEYLPYTIELGRAFVQPAYQSTQQGAKSLFALDNLWDGLGALLVMIPECKYCIGKMTVYRSVPVGLRDILRFFLVKYYADKESLVYPTDPLEYQTDKETLATLVSGNNFKEDYLFVKNYMRHAGFCIPPLINSYILLANSMKIFGSAVCSDSTKEEDTAMLMSIDQMNPDKLMRHVLTFSRESALSLRLGLLFRVNRVRILRRLKLKQQEG
ncbi:MAG: GNAT family N-acetyltransferase [Bacteroidaceae bacterium]|nr:GNAT family N-acetyltransferase [Bacteroidaceae bacterium]